MGRKRKSRIYQKDGRWYGDFRDYKQQGGRQEALVPPNQRRATREESQARALAAARLRELKRLRKAEVKAISAKSEDSMQVIDLTRLGDFADYHLECEVLLTTNTPAWLEQVDMHLRDAINFFGAKANLLAMGSRMTEYAKHLATLYRWGRAECGIIAPLTQRKYLNSLSKLLNRAIEMGVLAPGYNHVENMMQKPSGTSDDEAVFLDMHIAALVLYAAERMKRLRPDAFPYVHELISTFLLTGARRAEVLGLRPEDIDFKAGFVRIRKHKGRRLKTKYSARRIPLWPQLEAILRPYLERPEIAQQQYVFEHEGKRLNDVQNILDDIADVCGLEEGLLTSKVFRHTYCSTRMQTTDRGSPVAEFTVVRELGHGSKDMIEQVYAHPLEVYRRFEHVRYFVSDFPEELDEELKQLEVRLSARKIRNYKNRVDPHVEAAVLQKSVEQPTVGALKLSKLLAADGFTVSDTGVRGVWSRHGLGTIADREQAIKDGRLAAQLHNIAADVKVAA